MLQSRLENEQFTSLPNLITTDRSRTGFITTDRPDSSQLVDLHIYIIPKNVWKDVQHLAQNEAMEDAISAGFVRVSPHMKIRELRESIEQLCGNEDYFPRDFIYLRSVGRCMTRVKPRQENELKVKNYRPPQTFAPEIYLLEGRHEDYAHIPCASPTPSTTSYVFGNRHQHHFNHDDNNLSPTRFQQSFPRKPMRGGKHFPPIINANDSVSHAPSSGRQSWAKFTQIGSDPEESSTKDLTKLKEEQERLRRRQAELERMRRAAEEKKARSEREEEERRRQERAQAEREEEERRRRQEKAEAERRRLEQERAEAQRRRLQQEETAATKIQASYRGFKDRQTFKERKRNENQKLTSPKSTKSSHNNNEQEDKRHEINETLLRSSSIESISYENSSNTMQTEGSTIKKERTKSFYSNSSSSLVSSRKKDRSNLSTHSKAQETVDTAPFIIDSPVHTSKPEKKPHHNNNDDDNRGDKRNKIVPKQQQRSPLPKTPPEEKIIDDEIELERREAETRRRRQLEEEEQRRKSKEIEEQRRRELAKRQREDPEALRIRLQELRARRADLEKIREEVIKHLKNIHNRITLRRKEARDMWKKKYFIEKKKTPPLEERVMLLKSDLEQIHRKTVQTIDAEAKHASQMGYNKEADIGNFILQVTRTHHDIQDIRHQVEQAKLRLTTDVKLRNQAENECRSLRHELNQAKMNLNHIKTRVGA